MTKPTKAFVGLLIALNSVVLLGQLWPEGAPPFARLVNIAFLILNLLFFVALLPGKAVRLERGSS